LRSSRLAPLALLVLLAALCATLAAPAALAYSVDTSPFGLEQPQLAGRTVSAIVYEGNERTRERILDRVLAIHVGDPLDAAAVEASRQAILDTELFREVRVRVEADGAGGVRVVFWMSEKHYWVAYPKVGTNSSGDRAYGIHARFNNLFGLDHTLGLNIDQRNYASADLGTSEEVRARYFIPGIDHSRYDVEFRGDFVSLDRVERDPFGTQLSTYNENETGFSSIVTHWLGDRPIGHGWRLGGGFHYGQQTNDVITGSLGRDPSIRLAGLSFQATWRDMHYLVDSDTGSTFGARLEQGVPGASDDAYQIVELYGSRYWAVGEAEHTSLYLDGGFGLSANVDPNFVTFTFGRPNLRGVLKDVFDGDSYQYLRFGYLRPISQRHPALRYEVFMDLGRQRLSGFPDTGASNIGIGAGIRWRIRTFVKVELAFGVVYSPDTGDYLVWGGTHGLD